MEFLFAFFSYEKSIKLRRFFSGCKALTQKRKEGWHIWRESVLFLILFAAVIFDLDSGKIPNRLSAAGCLTGVGLNILANGLKGVLTGTAGILIPVVLLFPLFLFRMLGAGDIKLFAAAGSFFGPAFAVRHIVCSLAVGAVFSVLILVRNRNFSERLSVLLSFANAKGKRFRNYYIRERDGAHNALHFSVAMLLAYLFAVNLG